VPTLHLTSDTVKHFDAGAGDGARLMMLVLHGDAQREYAYGPAQGLPDTKVSIPTQALYDEEPRRTAGQSSV
jgi:hypothetical protein